MDTKKFDFQCKILKANDKKLIAEAADCLSQTFAGLEIGGTMIREPMAHVCNLSKDDLLPYVNEYVKNISSQGLCIVATTKDDANKVIGAMACEDFTPNEEPSVFEGPHEKLNKISEFLSGLNETFIKTIETKEGKKIQKNEYVHGMMVGVRTERNKKHIANEMLKVLSEEAKKKNYKALIVEATNFRSQKFNELYGFHVAKDLQNKPIVKKYSEDKLFRQIPEDVAVDCKLMIMPLCSDYIL